MDELENKKQIIREDLKKLAERLGKTPTKVICTQEKTLTYSYNQIIATYGTWNNAVKDAGLPITLRGKQRLITDEELIDEFIKVANNLGKIPINTVFALNSNLTRHPYIRKWGSWTKAVKFITSNYASKFNFELPEIEVNSKTNSVKSESENTRETIKTPINPANYNLDKIKYSTIYGAPMNFRGLTHEPINEQGVVFLFGMICKELGFTIEAIRTNYPDCEGKRCIDGKKNHWARVKIEFEYRSRNFKEHGHDPSCCDVIVCWENNWPECPLEVIELKSILSELEN